ncbi:hypothetical protein N7520_011777 [Penicillium odoratum]|uniref:uncharacterized protein n=1 Tax=Penicillium odoratum TaxID=1167516 RepID=UPI00254683BF|nr:uncharacterized protein N7520_011777 [Penicillium odoratum]KAJ5746595.1 hypothetical protein N7520_011777 [Penicillium odoratum]
MPFVESQNLIDRMRVFLEHLKALKAEVRGIVTKCAGAANQNPEAKLEPTHPSLAQRMQDYFRFLLYVFLGDLRTRLRTADGSIENVQDSIKASTGYSPINCSTALSYASHGTSLQKHPRKTPPKPPASMQNILSLLLPWK